MAPVHWPQPQSQRPPRERPARPHPGNRYDGRISWTGVGSTQPVRLKVGDYSILDRHLFPLPVDHDFNLARRQTDVGRTEIGR